jgi:cytochrome c biogenesis protein CcdA
MGVFFTLGVVIMYFLTGVGLSEGLRRLDVFPSVSRALTWLIIGGTFVLAAVSFWDFLTALRGRARDMKLKLPDRLRMRINAIISRRLHARSVAVGALGLGATVSLLEFVCTGQVYFPLIRYMTAVSDTRLRALGLLVLYCLAFAVPLIAVFVATYFGLRSERLVAALKRHVATAKFLLTAFFLGLGALLLRLELGRSL